MYAPASHRLLRLQLLTSQLAAIRQPADGLGLPRAVQEHLFRGIHKSEWTNLFNFIQAKKLRIDNLREAEMGPGAAGPQALDLGDDIDTGGTPRGSPPYGPLSTLPLELCPCLASSQDVGVG